MRVFVYRNLRENLWSVKALDGEHKGRVVLHAAGVVLANASFKVSEVGRQRVLKEKQKNVHAGVVGFILAVDVVRERYHTNVLRVGYPVDIHTYSKSEGVTYNPYAGSTFTYRDSGSPAEGSSYTVVLSDDMKVYTV
jgi:hypothetical protein